MYKLLIIDDQKSILKMLERRFAKLNYHVFTTDNREEALQILETTPIDLVLLDYMMPQVSGFDFYLSFSEKYDIPVIMMTAHSSINLVTEFMRNGGTDFIEKPLDMVMLLVRIERAIKQARLLKQQIVIKQKAELDLLESNKALFEKTQKLGQKNSELDAFTAAVSHDLKAPINNMIGFVNLLKKKKSIEKLDKEDQKYFSFIEAGVFGMNLLVTELLSFAKMQQVKTHIQLIDTQNLVAEIINIINVKNENNIQFNVETLPKVNGDLVLIRQVFYNIIHNAVKYSHTKRNPIISIQASRNDNETVFAIKDNGVGFNTEQADQLFEMFTRLRPKEFEGIGIGLANVKKIVERHDGRIWAKGKEGEGATFCFSLPHDIGLNI